jgi:hypothetical protein
MPAVGDAVRPIADAIGLARKSRDIAASGLEQRQEQIGRQTEILSRRLGLLSERKMSLDDAMLTRKLAGIQRGGGTSEGLIAEALGKPALMMSLRNAVRGDEGALTALRRHVWDRAGNLGPVELRQFIDANEPALKMVFEPGHLTRLKTIMSAGEMLESVPPPTTGRAIETDPLKRIKEMTGANPSAITARMIAVSRGRSSRTIESVVGLSNWFAERSKAGFTEQMKRALYDPDVARAMIEAADFPSAAAPKKVLRAWMLNSGIANPARDMMEPEGAR